MEPCNVSLFLLSEKSEWDLSTSERENGWWVAYRSNRQGDCSNDRWTCRTIQ